MNEFKMVVEKFESNQKKIIENMNHRFDKQDKRFDHLEQSMRTLERKKSSMMEQIALLLEGQTEIKAELRSELKNRVTYKEFQKLEKRVIRLEKKTA